jgi:hypothetical protein
MPLQVKAITVAVVEPMTRSVPLNARGLSANQEEEKTGIELHPVNLRYFLQQSTRWCTNMQEEYN